MYLLDEWISYCEKKKRETQKGRGSMPIEIRPWRRSPLRSVPTFTGHFFPHWFLGSHRSAHFNTHSKCPVRSRGQVCAGLCVGHWWFGDAIRQGLCLSWSSTGKASQRRGQLREAVQGECESGKQQGGVRQQREQVGEGPEAEGTGGWRAGSRGKSAGEGPEGEWDGLGTRVWWARHRLWVTLSQAKKKSTSHQNRYEKKAGKGCRKRPMCPFCLSCRE